MDDDPRPPEFTEDKTFITKILGEMKNQFNSDSGETDASGSKDHETVTEIHKIEPESESEPPRAGFECDEQPRIVMCFRKPGSLNKKQRARRSKRTKALNVVHLKRSTRRRSRDCGESVLQSAIARKEKSYNETAKPQRLTRQLKPTQKILENIAVAAALKQDRRRDKPKGGRTREQDELPDGAGALGRTLKGNKRLRTNHVKAAKEPTLDAEIKCRRSDRFLSNCAPAPTENDRPELDEDEGGKAEDTVKVEKDSDEEASLSASASAQLIASRLCVCSNQTSLYVHSNGDEEVFCTGIDSVGDKLVGCNNLVNGDEASMIRPSPRVPYNVLCKLHRNRMLRHNCCPTCGIFCTQGRFSQCKNKHQYHRDCQITVGELECCPHCGVPTPTFDVSVSMVSARPPLFTLAQKSTRPDRKTNVQDRKVFSNESERECPSPPIISLEDLKLTNTLVKPKERSRHEIRDLLASIRAENHQDVATILGSGNVDPEAFVTFEDDTSGTVLHYSAKKGLLPVLHMLKTADMDLNVLDGERYTALMLAVLAFQNEAVRYLTRAGANVTTKGMDGMTALHLSAKSGNLEATKILLSAAVHIKGYIDFADDGGWSPLVWACEHGHVDIAGYLLGEGADPVLVDVEQNSALHWAAFSGSSRIVEMILNFGGEVNALNSHGDSPLHIAARQDNYNCVLVLLARDAGINVANKVGECPVDCCPESSRSYEALSLNMHLQSLVTVDDKSLAFLSHDISGGKEPHPIACVNDVDEEKYPSGDFVYVKTNCVTSDIAIDWKITTLRSCACEDRCGSGSCDCGLRSLRNCHQRRLSDHEDQPVVFECNQVCSCRASTCRNRVVQRGTQQRLQVFRTRKKGWAVRTTRSIPSGTYVSEYVGELITDAEADNRDDDTYLFELGNRDEDTYCIDAKYYGNFSRFINHSCDPNLIPVRVFVDHHDVKFPRIALFASRDIDTSEELCFDYGEKFWIIKCKYFTCKCGADTCRYCDEAIASTLERYYANPE